MTTKVCTQCGVEKDISLFGTRGGVDTRPRSYCRSCAVNYSKKYNTIHSKERSDYIKRYAPEYRKTDSGKRVISTYRKQFEKTYVRPKREILEKEKQQNRDRYALAYSTPEGKQKIKDRIEKYLSTPLGKMSRVRGKHKRRMCEYKSECTLSLAQWNKILKMQQNKCAICHNKFTRELIATKDHIIPVSKGGGLTFENTQALCQKCNSKKRNKLDHSNIITWVGVSC